MYCSSTPSSFVKGRFALKPLTNSGVKLFCVQANCPTSCIDTGSCHKCLCFLDDFIRSLEYTIVNECNCKAIFGEIMMEYLSIKQTSEKWGITVRRIQILCIEGGIPGATKI